MRRNLFFLALPLLLTVSCEKADEIVDPPKPNNPFGVLINSADGVDFPTNQKVSFVKDVFKVPYTRVSIAIPNWTGSLPSFESFANADVKILLNVSSKVTNETTPPGPFITDTTFYRTKISEILNKYKPEVLVVENEETNENYYTSPPSDYINILKIAIEEGHKRGIKVANGGIPLRTSTLLCWDNYYSNGQTAAAADYALRAFPSAISANMPAFMSSNIQAQQMLAKAKTLINAYRTLQLDYVNFHWYELVTQREIAAQTADLPTLAHVDMKAFEETYNYYKTATSKPVITNEIGQINKVGSLLTDVVTKCHDLKVPYVIWYSGDGGLGQATALYDGTGNLRDNGNAFKNFITSKY